MERPKRYPDVSGKVITFYSYKGGVGRSFVLANVAAQLALWGYKVLCLDWDLEAPGLIDYFREVVDEKVRRRTKGVVELLGEFQDESTSDPDWRNHVITADLRHKILTSQAGKLDIVQAGRAAPGNDYVDKVRKLDWGLLYEERNLAEKLDAVKSEWMEEYDFVFVDSRTGISDVSGVCTIQLPDILVLVLTATYQSLDGIREVAERAVKNHSIFPYSRGRLLTVPVISKFDQREEVSIAETWLARITKGVDSLYNSWLDKNVPVSRILEFSKVPYISRWSFGESLSVLQERGTDPEQVSYSIQNVACLLVGGITNSKELVENRGEMLREWGADTSLEAGQVVEDETARRILDIGAADLMFSYANMLGKRKGGETDAQILFERAIELAPKDAEGIGDYANFLSDHRKDYDRAGEMYERALEFDPEGADHTGNYALFLTNQRKDYDRAEAMYERALELDPEDADNTGNYGLFLTNQRKDYDRAEAMFERALELDPENADHTGNYAVFLTNQRKDYDRAEVMFERALELDPEDAHHTGNYALFLKNQRKDYDRAEAMYERALELDPENAHHTGNYAIFLKNQRKDYDRAEAMFERALALDPENAHHTGNYAVFLCDQRKNQEKAEAMYDQALKLDPEHPNNTGNFSGFLFANGETDRAMSLLEKAFELAKPPEEYQDLILELLFYRLAHVPDASTQATLQDIVTMLDSGARSPNWPFENNIEPAVAIDPAKRHLLETVAAVINDRAPVSDIYLLPEFSGASKLSYYTMPLWFKENEDYSPQVCATATLLRQNGESYLVTAGHVDDSLIRECGLPFVATKDGTISPFHAWTAFKTNDQSKFQPDIEFIHLLDEPKSLAQFLKWAEPEQDSDGDPYDHFFAIGFAATRNKRPKHVTSGMTLKIPSSTILTCKEHPHKDRVLEALGYQPENHEVVSFQRRSYQKEGVKVFAPHPHGMSGGALFGIRETDEGRTVHLCGILTDYLENRAAIVATKIGLVRHLLHPYRNASLQSSDGWEAAYVLPDGTEIELRNRNLTLGGLITLAHEILNDPMVSEKGFGVDRYFFYVNSSRGTLISDLDLSRPLSTLPIESGDKIELRLCRPLPNSDGTTPNPMYGVKHSAK